MNRLRHAVFACALVGLAGCTTMSDINRKSVSDYSQTAAQAQTALQRANKHHAELRPVMSSLPYVNTHVIAHTEGYPPVFAEKATLNAPAEQLWELAEQLHAVIGIPVHADDDLLTAVAAPSTETLPPPPMDATLTPPPAAVGATGLPHTSSTRTLPMSYQGTVEGMLDHIAGKLDASWSYDAHTRTIHLFRYETRTFHIDTTPGDSSSASAISSGQGNAIQGTDGQIVNIAQSKSQTQFGDKLSVWSSVESAIKPMLSSSGTLSVSEPTATITVRDRWDRVNQVASYVKSINASLGTQVEVNVTVYRVHSADSDNRGINWSALYNAVGQSASTIGVAIATPRPAVTGLASLVLNTPIVRPNGTTPPWSGSQFFLDALSTLGKTSVVQQVSIETVNNTPAPVKNVQTTAYAAEATSLLTTGVSSGTGVVGAGATIKPGQVETGFNMQVLPSVQQDGHRILLQVLLSISTLDQMVSFTSGGTTIQEPQVSSREFLQRVWMSSGNALVLAGFQSTASDNTTATPLSKPLWMFGGNRSVSRSHDALVIVITPIATAPSTTF